MAQVEQGVVSPLLLLNPCGAWWWAGDWTLTTGSPLPQGVAMSLGFSHGTPGVPCASPMHPQLTGLAVLALVGCAVPPGPSLLQGGASDVLVVALLPDADDQI